MLTTVLGSTIVGTHSATSGATSLNYLKRLEAESIYILRETVAEFQRPVMLYSIGKDSSVMLRLAQKAFYPGKIPFPLLHVDTSYKFPEMIEFRDRDTREIGADLIVHRNQRALDDGANPFRLGTQKCCGFLKTTALLDALREGSFDAAFGGARRDEDRRRSRSMSSHLPAPSFAISPRLAKIQRLPTSLPTLRGCGRIRQRRQLTSGLGRIGLKRVDSLTTL